MKTNRRRKKEELGGSDWLAVYSDMVTLLLTFFVLLFSFSTIDAEKWRQLVRTFGGGESVIGQHISSRETNSENTVTSLVVSDIESIPIISEHVEPSSAPVSSRSPSSRVSSKVVRSSQVVSQPSPSSHAVSSEQTQSETPAVSTKLDGLYADLSDYVDQSSKVQGVILDRGVDSIRIRFIGTVFFEQGQADIKPSSMEVINQISQIIAKHSDSINFVESQGHTDNSPLDNELFKDNWQLSGARAYNVLTELLKNSAIDAKKIKFSGYGEEHPIDTNETQEGRDKNNRVDIILS